MYNELQSVLNKPVLIRRGRNNRIFAKLIDRNVFCVQSDEEDQIEIKYPLDLAGKMRLLGRRKKRRVQKYRNAIDYLSRERSELMGEFNGANWCNKRTFSKLMRKTQSKPALQVIDSMVQSHMNASKGESEGYLEKELEEELTPPVEVLWNNKNRDIFQQADELLGDNDLDAFN